MGKRFMRVSPELLIDLAKGPNGRSPRAFTIDNPLPADTHVVEVRRVTRRHQAVIAVVLESEDWPDTPGLRILDPLPTWNIHFLAPPIPPEDRNGSAGEISP